MNLGGRKMARLIANVNNVVFRSGVIELTPAAVDAVVCAANGDHLLVVTVTFTVWLVYP